MRGNAEKTKQAEENFEQAKAQTDKDYLGSPVVLCHNGPLKIKILWLMVVAVTVCSTSLLGQDFLWTQSGAPNQPWQFVTSSSDGTKFVAAVQNGGIYTSTNSGATWILSSAPNVNWLSAASSSDGSKLVAVVYGGGIYTSINSGAEWIQRSAPNANWVSAASSSDGSKLVAAVNGGVIYTSTNSGVAWVSNNVPKLYWNSVASSSDGSKLVALFGVGGIYTSTNSGAAWTQTTAPNANWFLVASSSDGSKLVAGVYDGEIYTSTNSGAAWTQTSLPTNVYWYSVASSSDGNKFVAVVLGGGIYTSTDSGATWILTSAPTSSWISVASSSDGTRLVAAIISGGIYTAYIKTNPPSITQQPFNLASCPGSSSVLGVTVTGTPPFDYHWRKDGTNLVNGGNVTGSTTTNLTLLNVSQSDSARYDVIITNVVGSVTSSVATLFVTSVPAKATPIIDNGFIVGAILTDGGCGYTNQPAVIFSGQGGSGAAGYVQINNGSATNIVITDAGFGYPTNTVAQVAPPFFPAVSIALTNTPAAAAIPIITNMFVVGANLTAAGSGYTVAPAVTFSDSSGHGATAHAQISNGAVTNIVITSAGSGYSSNTVINIPPAAYLNAVIPSANSLMLGQPYRLQIASDLNNWTNYGLVFTATNNAWTSTGYWNVANAARIFFRLQMLP